MTSGLWCLLANALWGFGLVLLEITGKTRIAGTSWNMGNREVAHEFPAWIERTSRALSNHKENFPLFLTAVIVVRFAGREDTTTAVAGIVYVVARMAHAILYVGGVKQLRSAAFSIGVIAIFVMLSRLI